MSTVFSVIVDDFSEGLTSLRQLIQVGSLKSTSAKTRVASAHASTLLLAATFEEFVREMAREFAVQIVDNASHLSDLPDILIETAWRRTFDDLARSKPNARTKKESLAIAAKQARPKLDALCSFIEGDISQNVFGHLIHNENNMRAGEINKLFKISGLSNVCAEVCKQPCLKEFFAQDDEKKAHGELLAELEQFFERRNGIAHSLNSVSSSAPAKIARDLDMFLAFSKDLGSTLETAAA